MRVMRDAIALDATFVTRCTYSRSSPAALLLFNVKPAQNKLFYVCMFRIFLCLSVTLRDVGKLEIVLDVWCYQQKILLTRLNPK